PSDLVWVFSPPSETAAAFAGVTIRNRQWLPPQIRPHQPGPRSVSSAPRCPREFVGARQCRGGTQNEQGQRGAEETLGGPGWCGGICGGSHCRSRMLRRAEGMRGAVVGGKRR